MDSRDSAHSQISLRYRKGDLIMKEGDYGISIYYVKKGHVRVSKKQGNSEIDLATLGPGEVFGEMVFLNKTVETRSASVRALDEVELEVWHPASLSREYNQMPPILKFITNQTLARLTTMNRMYAQLLKKKKSVRRGHAHEQRGDTRKYYRKEFNRPCTYRPLNGPDKPPLKGLVAEISVAGASMTVGSRNTLAFKHTVDDEIVVFTSLPSGRELELPCIITAVNKDHAPGDVHIGLKFMELDGETAKAIGFFMIS